ncbi:MAG TPA: pantoate--beta-alanine ligase [Povalibacter sp.]|uniref:pantoate--beta-alanine ligase n=1 Tax=Povalibacter sp. TaxID=1962978 RepID=UPI002BB865E1|nr:pantoate--beta-alanine ligase [Povalibacter sp.]HMN43433.1 pantoate--beta-alanine ligase [Povalibacter sp.]
MDTIVRSAELRRAVALWRKASERVAFVPTMGNLHQGHGDLVRRALDVADRVVVSVFVNPMQFGPNEDFAAYPRTPEDDRRLLESIGADVLFTPDVDEMYPRGQAVSTRVQVPEIDSILCGAFRPGHFTGVATIVTKLLNLVQPDVALFGEKDFQQLMIIRRAATDLCMPMEIVGVPTTRESDGLAMSSRNRYLSADERKIAPQIHAALSRAREAIESGSQDFAALEQAGFDALKQHGFRPDYFSIRDAATLGDPVPGVEMVVLTAARIGRARLIDNVRAQPPRR